MKFNILGAEYEQLTGLLLDNLKKNDEYCKYIIILEIVYIYIYIPELRK